MGNKNSGRPKTDTQACFGEPGPTEWRSWGNAAMKAKDYPKAIDDFTHGIATSRNKAADADLYASRAACFISLGQYTEALADAEACIRLRPGLADGFIRKGEALEGLVRLSEAVAAFGGALVINPRTPELLDKVKSVRDRATRYQLQVQLMLSGNDAMSGQNFPKAIKDFTKAIDADPNCEATAAIYANRAECHSLLGHHADALADANACVRLRPDSSEGYVRRGTALEGVGRLDKAVTAYEFALAVDPNNQNIDEKLTAVRARCYTEKQLSQNSDDYTREVDPNCEAAAAIYSNRAASLTSLKRYPEALADADACIRLRPDWLKGYFRKGAALEGLGQLDEAVKAFEGALTVDPKNEELQEKLTAARDQVRARNDRLKPQHVKTPQEAKTIGNSLFGQGKYDVAAEFYTRAIDLETEDTPDKAACFSNRAACYQQVHNFSGVISDATSAICIVPGHSKALLRRAIAYEALEKWQKALDDYNAVHSISPGMQNVSQGIMRCQRSLRSL